MLLRKTHLFTTCPSRKTKTRKYPNGGKILASERNLARHVLLRREHSSIQKRNVLLRVRLKKFVLYLCEKWSSNVVQGILPQGENFLKFKNF